MPSTATPSRYLSETLARMQQQLDELSRAIGRPVDQVRDSNDNVLHMPAVANHPVQIARDQDVGLAYLNGRVTAVDEQGRDTRDLAARTIFAGLTGDTHGVHHGDVGVNGTEYYNHYGDLHGNSYGFHYGPVGDGSTQNQINALNVYSTGHFGTQHGDVGTPSEFWQLYGTVHAPSERGMKAGVTALTGAGELVDAVPAYRWRWRADLDHAITDESEHAGPMVDDIDDIAPWLVRRFGEDAPRSLTDRDLIGVLWAALRQTRHELAAYQQVR